MDLTLKSQAARPRPPLGWLLNRGLNRNTVFLAMATESSPLHPDDQEYLYVQLWKVRTEWLALSEQERLDFVYQIGLVIKELLGEGAILVGFSLNDFETPHRMDYRYMATWKVESPAMVQRIDKAFEEAGWGEYFDVVNARGHLVPPQDLLRHMVKL